MRKKALFLATAGLCGILAGCGGTDAVTAGERPQVSDNIINIAVVGDSITHGGHYLRNLQLFYLTRYPEMPTKWHNRGLGGETAARYLSIIDVDLFRDPLPDKVIVMFGMNDLGLDLYMGRPGRNLEAKAEAIVNYQSSMRELITRINDAGIGDIVLFVPSPFDNVLESGTVNNATGYNDALAEQKKFLQELAEEFDARVIDMNTPLVEANERFRKLRNADVSVIGEDRIHPGPLGAWLMTHAYLTQTGANGLAQVTINAETMRVTSITEADIYNLSGSARDFSFTYNPWRLPMYPSEAYSVANELVPLTDWYNNERLSIIGLEKDGKYELLINGVVAGVFPGHELFGHPIDLANLPLNPNHVRAGEMYRIAEDLRAQDDDLRRVRLLQLYVALRGHDVNDERDFAAGVRHFRDRGDEFQRWLVSLYDAKPIDERESEIAAWREELLTLNTPISFEITVRRIGD